MEYVIILGWPIYFFVFLLGLTLGSFLNSWMWRTRDNIKMRGRSVCTSCYRQLCWYENIPLLSFFILKRRCRVCKKKISWHYPLVEFFTAVALVIIFWHHVNYYVPFNPGRLWRDIFFLTLLIIIFTFDYLYKIILSRIILLGALGGFLFNWFLLGYSARSMFLGAVFAGGFFLLQFLISRGRWIGGGDVRLGAMMGIWLGWPYVLVALFFAYIIGAIFSVGLLTLKKKEWKSQLPFGAFLAVATFFAIYYSDNVVNWYMRMIR